MMAAWSNDHDIARDLNELSEFKNPSHDLKVKSYTSSWGRGRIKFEDCDMPETPVQPRNPTEEFKWFPEKPIGKLPDSLSRGKKLEILKENLFNKGREEEVREQLRAAMGPGHSNELIEATFKPRVGPVRVNGSVKFGDMQFEDSEQDDTPKTIENIALNVSEKSSSETKAGGVVNIKSKRRRYRNVVLESLERINNSSDTNHSADLKLQFSDNALQIQKQIAESTVKNIPPACYVPFKKKSNSFEYCDTDFPKL